MEERKVLYQNLSYSDCFAGVNLSHIEPAIDNEISIFPIPFKEQ
jgi:hypothetical protein